MAERLFSLAFAAIFVGLVNSLTLQSDVVGAFAFSVLLVIMAAGVVAFLVHSWSRPPSGLKR